MVKKIEKFRKFEKFEKFHENQKKMSEEEVIFNSKRLI